MILTKRQQDILDYIKGCETPPSYREIGKRFGITSVNGVANVIQVLEKKGFIKRKRRESRGIRVVGQVKGWQPIETAPKDGTNILLFRKESPQCVSVICIGYYDKTSPDGIPWKSGFMWSNQFTHWQPLPQLPQGEQQ